MISRKMVMTGKGPRKASGSGTKTTSPPIKNHATVEKATRRNSLRLWSLNMLPQSVSGRGHGFRELYKFFAGERSVLVIPTAELSQDHVMFARLTIPLKAQ